MPQTKPDDANQIADFEKSLDELEKLVAKMEDGEQSLTNRKILRTRHLAYIATAGPRWNRPSCA